MSEFSQIDTENLIDRKVFRKKLREHMTKHADTLLRVLTINRENKLSFGQIIESNAEQWADKVAIFFEERTITYKEYNEIVNQYAHYFLSLGLKKGDIVDIVIKNRPEVLIIIGALGKIGAIGSMINADLREKSLLHSLTITLGKALIIGEECFEAFSGVQTELGLTDQILLFSPDIGEMATPETFIDISSIIKEFPTSNPPTTKEIKTYDHFLFIFTSGTTGLPKAAHFPNQRFLVGALYMGSVSAEYTSDDILYITTPLFHSNTLIAGVGATFMSGASMVLARKFSASRFWDDVRKYKATAFNYVGELCRYLLNQPPRPDDADNTIKTILGNGLRPEVWMEFKTRFGIEKITEFYGATEAGGMFINLLNFDKTCGYYNQVYAIVKYDVEKDEPVREENGFMKKVRKGEAGLLLFPYTADVRFVGYKDESATEAKLFRNALKEGDTWINTGDLVRDQGCSHVMFVDRLGDTFRWKGHNISTTEVERIFNAFGGVSMSCVYGVPIPGTDGRAGMAVISTDTKIEDFDFKGLATQLLDNLAPYAVPIFLRFKSEMSTTATHKLKKTTLKKECFEIEEIDDPLYVMLPSESTYTKLTPEIYEKIQDGQYMF